MNSDEVNFEKKRLLKVIDKINKELKKLSYKKNNYESKYKKLSKEMWIQLGGDVELFEGVQYMGLLQQNVMSYSFYSEKIRKLSTLRKSAYFGRIDFMESGYEDIEQIYIGMFRFVDDATQEILIYDWRAPICSLFYSSDLGPCRFTAVNNNIDGELLKKRQFNILYNDIIDCFDSSIKIDDTILQSILANNTSHKIKTIVESIQKEQNRAIREDKNKTLLVWGPAGCGKTSVALHRAAWLLYTYRESIKANNIIIISPNQIFDNYLSDILPELGEENVLYNTFFNLCLKNLPQKYAYGSLYDYTENLLKQKGVIQNVKRSDLFLAFYSDKMIEAIDFYINQIASNNFFTKDIRYQDDIILPTETMKSIFLHSQQLLNLKARIGRLYNYTLQAVEEYINNSKNKWSDYYKDTDEIYDDADIKKLVKSRTDKLKTETALTIKDIFEIDPVKLYMDFIENIEKCTKNEAIISFIQDNKKEILSDLSAGIVDYIHLPPIFYIHTSLFKIDIGTESEVKHVIIDEVQDYTILQLHIIKEIFKNASFTMLGDVNQSIYQHNSIKDSSHINHLFDNRDVAEMRFYTSYRSTKQITHFCNKILGYSDEVTAVNREGDIPQIIECNNEDITDITNDLINQVKEKYNSIAVITRTKQTSDFIFYKLKGKQSIKTINQSDTEFNSGLCILPSYLAKGLEFDCVIVLCTAEDYYRGDEERKLYYTVCSRALHKLRIIHTGKIML